VFEFADSVAESGKHFLGKRHVIRVIDALAQTEQIGAVFVDEMTSVNRFVVRARFRNLFPSRSTTKTVGSHRSCRARDCLSATLVMSDDWKPAPMLIGCFEIHVGGIAQFGMQRAKQLCAKRRCRSKHRSCRCVSLCRRKAESWARSTSFNSNQCLNRVARRDRRASE